MYAPHLLGKTNKIACVSKSDEWQKIPHKSSHAQPLQKAGARASKRDGERQRETERDRYRDRESERD